MGDREQRGRRTHPPTTPLTRTILGDDASGARATPEAPGRHRLTLHFDSPTAACRRLLPFGPDAEVLEPASVRTRLAETARATAARYG
ncbi:WYL domain-containing protein [Streptomyces sp. NPDC101152]|uniref:WYL domain-containing protein n=1 Tax=Streptomyces sp. NPDC101152 TaxID=3366116 RepID=UPI00381565E2